MATEKSTRWTRRDYVRAFASCAVRARREHNKQDWLIARREWERLATPTERRRPPAAIARPWED